MTFIIAIADGFVPKDPAGVLYAVRDALDFAGIPADIREHLEQDGVDNILDCSTLHVTPADMDLLNEKAGVGRSTEVLAYPNEYGAFLYVPSPSQIAQDFECKEDYLNALREDGFSESFLKVLELAAAKNCIWVKLDRDGHIWKELDENDWK